MKNLEKMKKFILEAKELKGAKAESDRVNMLIQKAIAEQMKALQSATGFRKGSFDTSLATRGMDSGKGSVNLNKSLLETSTPGSDLRDFQKKCDDVYSLSIICGVHPTELQAYQNLRNTKMYKTVYDTGDFDNTYWWPNTLSRDMIEEVEKVLKVAALHRTIQMPTNPYRIPARTGRSRHYLVAESVDETGVKAPLTMGPMPATGITFEAKKLMARVIISDETTEDMVLPIIQMIKDDIARSAAEAIEEACINGQTVAETIDTQLSLASNDSRRAWNGYRVNALGGGWAVDLSGWTALTDKTDVLLLRKMRATMGRYGITPADLVWIVSINGYNQFLNIPEMLTPDKYQAEATLLKGEMGRVDNIPVVISEFLPENLNASGAYTSDTDNDYTCILLLYVGGWAHGERAKFTLKTYEEPKTDQHFLISRMRRDFQPLYMGATYSDSIVCVGYGLPNTMS